MLTAFTLALTVATHAHGLTQQPNRRRLNQLGHPSVLPRAVTPRSTPRHMGRHHDHHLMPRRRPTRTSVRMASATGDVEIDGAEAINGTTSISATEGVELVEDGGGGVVAEVVKDGIGLTAALILLNMVTVLWGTQVCMPWG